MFKGFLTKWKFGTTSCQKKKNRVTQAKHIYINMYSVEPGTNSVVHFLRICIWLNVSSSSLDVLVETGLYKDVGTAVFGFHPILCISFSCNKTLARSILTSKLDSHDFYPNSLTPPPWGGPAGQGRWWLKDAVGSDRFKVWCSSSKNPHFLLQWWLIHCCHRQYVFQQ